MQHLSLPEERQHQRRDIRLHYGGDDQQRQNAQQKHAQHLQHERNHHALLVMAHEVRDVAAQRHTESQRDHERGQLENPVRQDPGEVVPQGDIILQIERRPSSPAFTPSDRAGRKRNGTKP